MHAFRRHARLDAVTYKDPGVEDRSGPPLSQGFLFTVIGAVAAEHCSPEMHEVLSKIDPDAWYHGQLLESILERFERKNPAVLRRIGRSVYLMMRAKLAESGITSVRQMLASIPFIWLNVTRGDGGVWRVELSPDGSRSARLEAEQPYSCQFEEGAVVGLLECVGARNVQITHDPCMRRGAPFCGMQVTWDE